MKPKAIIITENNSEAYEIRGVLAKIFYFFYFLIYRLEVIGLTLIFRKNYSLELICARDLFPKGLGGIDKIYYYDDLFRSADFKKKRELLLNFVKTWFADPAFSDVSNDFYFEKIFLPDIVKTRFAIILAYLGIPIYWHSFEEIFEQEKPKKIILMSRVTKPEIIGEYLAKKKNISYFSISLSLSNVDSQVKKYFRYLDRKLRVKEMLSMSEKVVVKNDIKPRVLLVASMPMYLKSAVPLIQKFKKGDSLLLSAIVETEDRLKELKKEISWEYLFSYLPRETIDRVYQANLKKFKIIYDKNKDKSPKSHNDQGLLFKLAKEELRLLFYSYFPLSCVYILAFKSFLKQTRIDKVIVFSDRGIFENVACKIGKLNGIQTIHVSPNNVMSPDRSNEYEIAEYLTVPGEFMRKELVNIGRDPRKISVVGDLKLEDIDIYKSVNFKNEVRKKYRLEKNKKIVLLISWPIIPSVPYLEKEAFFKAVYESVGKMPNAKLVVKPHPNESVGTLREYIKIWGMGSVPVIPSLDLLELLAVSNVMVMIWSMAAFEAIAMDVPVIAVNFARKDYGKHIPYAKEKGAIEVFGEKDLYENLKKLLEDKKFRRETIRNGLVFAQKYVGPLDGKAAERIVEVINKVH